MSGAARRVAKASSRLSRRHAEHVARRVELALVLTLEPLTCELVRGGVLEEGMSLVLGAELRRFDQQFGLEVGDSLAVSELDSGEFLALSCLTDREVTYWTDNGGAGGGALPAGGTLRQGLAKASAADYDAEWIDLHEVPAGGTTRQALVKDSDDDWDTEWLTLHEVPAGGATGTVLGKLSGADYDDGWIDLAADLGFIRYEYENNDGPLWIRSSGGFGSVAPYIGDWEQPYVTGLGNAANARIGIVSDLGNIELETANGDILFTTGWGYTSWGGETEGASIGLYGSMWHGYIEQELVYMHGDSTRYTNGGNFNVYLGDVDPPFNYGDTQFDGRDFNVYGNDGGFFAGVDVDAIVQAGEGVYVEGAGSGGTGTSYNDGRAFFALDLAGFQLNVPNTGDFVVSGGHDFIFYSPAALGSDGAPFGGGSDFLTYLGGGDFISYLQGGEVLWYVVTQDNEEGNAFIVYTDGTRYGGDQLFYPGTGDWQVLPYKGLGADPFETAGPEFSINSSASPLGYSDGSAEFSQENGGSTFDFTVHEFEGAYFAGNYFEARLADKHPDTGYPVLFDVDPFGAGNNVGAYVSTEFVPLGGLVVQALSPFTANTYAGIAVDLSGDDASTIDGYTLHLIAGGSIVGHHDYIESPGFSAVYGHKGVYVDAGGGAYIAANRYSVSAEDAASAFILDASVTAGDSSEVAIITGIASVGAASDAYGVNVTAIAAGAASTAYGVQSVVSGTGGALAYSGWFAGGDFHVENPDATLDLTDGFFVDLAGGFDVFALGYGQLQADYWNIYSASAGINFYPADAFTVNGATLIDLTCGLDFFVGAGGNVAIIADGDGLSYAMNLETTGATATDGIRVYAAYDLSMYAAGNSARLEAATQLDLAVNDAFAPMYFTTNDGDLAVALGAGAFTVDSDKVGVFGVAPVTQRATPTTLADVILGLQQLGFFA